MGNFWPPPPKGQRVLSDESAISLSDNCVTRITKDEKKCAHSKPSKLKDGEWAKKLKCLDDIHSHENGITYQCMMALIKMLEEEISDYRPPVCDPAPLMTCLKKNQNCVIKCKRYVDDFIGCVDAQRINIIKEKYEMDKKNNSKEANELAKQFLKQN